MKQRPSVLAGWIFAGLCTLGFFLPWARFAPESVATNTLAIANTLVQGEEDPVSSYLWMRRSEASALLKRPADGLSAYQIILLSEEDTLSSKVARAWLSMLWSGDDTALRVKVIVLIPILAFLGAVFLTPGKTSQRHLLFVGLLQAGAYVLMRWKMNAAYTDRMLWQIELGWGLWICLYALLGAACVALVRGLLPAKVRF
ncbi:MAG: hypothetical protein SFU85_10995 [Candidatus Methylacidiphilales bacterium]|nr:hypothetical protein [Candidatus Methylacidiphilales bacterium]